MIWDMVRERRASCLARIASLLLIVASGPILARYAAPDAWSFWASAGAAFVASIVGSIILYRAGVGIAVVESPAAGSPERRSELVAPAPKATPEPLPVKPASSLLDSNEFSRLRHDILSPLNAAIGFLELLEEGGNLGERQRRHLANVNGSLASIVALLERHRVASSSIN